MISDDVIHHWSFGHNLAIMKFVKAVENIYGIVNLIYLLPSGITIFMNIFEKVMNMKDYHTKKRINCYFYEIKKYSKTILPDKSQKYIILLNLIEEQVIWESRDGIYTKYPFLLCINVRKFMIQIKLWTLK